MVAIVEYNLYKGRHGGWTAGFLWTRQQCINAHTCNNAWRSSRPMLVYASLSTNRMATQPQKHREVPTCKQIAFPRSIAAHCSTSS
jgi:hypothetical protein